MVHGINELVEIGSREEAVQGKQYLVTWKTVEGPHLKLIYPNTKFLVYQGEGDVEEVFIWMLTRNIITAHNESTLGTTLLIFSSQFIRLTSNGFNFCQISIYSVLIELHLCLA